MISDQGVRPPDHFQKQNFRVCAIRGLKKRIVGYESDSTVVSIRRQPKKGNARGLSVIPYYSLFETAYRTLRPII
ncbi:MAG TPA: hypothetical protein DCS67_07770 [Clostridiales bacterium UBA8960]|nr:hypothetical protein [Clostridiales bacterium UBA8960]